MRMAHDHLSHDLVCIVQSHGEEEGALRKVRQFSESVRSLRDPDGPTNMDRGWLLVRLLPQPHLLCRAGTLSDP